MTDTRERMKDGRLYFCTDEEIANEQLKCLDLLYDYNQTRPIEQAEAARTPESSARGSRRKLLHRAATPTRNWGRNTHLGSNVYANFNLTLVDDTDVYIGDSVMIGPNVTIATAGHPIDPELRSKVAQFNIPVRIGNNVWIGAGAVILPGITIGDDQRNRRGQHRDERTFPPGSWRSATRAAYCARSATVTGNSTTKTGKSICSL